MKIPKKVRISGVDYTVIDVPDLNDGVSVCYGRIDFENSMIKLNPDILGHQKMCCTLWHEIIHGIVEAANMSIEEADEETIVDTIAKGVYQVLQDNGKALFDLYEGD